MAEEALKFLSEPATLASLGAIAFASMYYIISRPKAIPCCVDLSKMSLEIPGDLERARVSAFHPDLLETWDESVRTVADAFLRGVDISGHLPCMGKRHDGSSPYKWFTYDQILERVETFASGLIELGTAPNTDTFIGIYSPNKIEWVIAEKACNLYSMVIVPLYDTLGPQAVSYIINQAKIACVVCDETKVDLLLNQAEDSPGLKYIIKIGHAVGEEEKQKAQEKGIQLLHFLEVEEIGRNHPHEKNLPSPDDLATICYTSGTTGNPKGAMITHKNIVSMMSAVIVLVKKMGFTFDNTEVYISYLPLPHMYERLMVTTVLTTGGRVGFYQGDIKLLMEDIKELRPTVFASVPRLLNRVYDKVTQQVSSAGFVKRFIYNMAMWFKGAEVKRGIVRKNSIWDYLVFQKVQNSLGGKVKYVISGSAPLTDEVMTFLRCAMGCFVLEGYGQTETTAAATTQLVGDPTVGHVGPPLPCNKIKLVDVPDMGYYAKNGQGEVCFSGHNVFKGYLYDQEKTDEVLDADGWLHSGDIGQWLPNGTLKLVDRKKHIFKLSQGEYIAPEKVENIYRRSKFVGQVFVYGDSFQSCLVGIVVPDVEVLRKWAPEKGITGGMEEWCQSEEVNKAILADLTAEGKKKGLFSFEQVKAVYLHPELFTVENGLLTPTFKSKRPELKKFFKENIEHMYHKLNQTS